MKDSDRLNGGKIEILNKKVSSLLKEVAVLSRSTKRGGGGGLANAAAAAAAAAAALAKDSGGSGTDSPSTN